MTRLDSHLIHLLILISLTLTSATCQSQNSTYLRTQYTKDIEHLNDKISNFQLKQQSYIQVLPLPNDTQPIYNTVYLQAQTVWLAQNQFAELSYQSIKENLINIKIQQAVLSQKDIQTYPTAQDHYKLNNSHFTSSLPYPLRACKVNDPEIQLKKIRSTFIGDLDFVKFFNQQKILLFLTELGQYRILMFNKNILDLYVVNIDLWLGLYSRSELHIIHSVQIEGFSSSEGMFLFQYEKERIFVYKNGTIWQVTVKENEFQMQKYGEIFSSSEQVEPSKDQKYQVATEQPQKIIPLKFGFLIQFQTYFQIYQEQIQQMNQTQQTPSLKKFLPKLSVPYIKKLTKSHEIASIVVSQKLSHQSGYKIYVLLKSSVLIELQYGSYSSISLYKIPYGQNFHSLSVQDDIVEIAFSITKSKKPHFYGMELLIDRKQNPRTPKIFLNRFYNDLKDLNKVTFFKEKELFIIGQTDVLIYDWPVDTSTLLKENITQTPYHFAVADLQSIYSFERYSTNDTDYVLMVSKKQLTIAKLTRRPQTIECSSDKSFDSRIEILKFCDSNRNAICKYVASMRVIIENPDAQRMNAIKRYLIIGLIVAIVLSTFVVVRKICQNKRTIEKLEKLKEKINKKYNELEVKGNKISQEDKFEQLQEEVPQHGGANSGSKGSGELPKQQN